MHKIYTPAKDYVKIKHLKLNPLTATTAIWGFAAITQTHAAVCLTSADMFLYAFIYPVHLF